MRPSQKRSRLIVVMSIACAVASAARPGIVRAQDEPMVSAAAAPASRPARGPDGPLIRRAREILSSLNLSDEQKRKVDAVLAKAAAEGREMMGAMDDMDPRDRMERMRERFADVREQIAAVLNDEQKAAFRERLEAARKELAGAVPGGPPAAAQSARPGQMIERLRENLAKLELTPEQKRKAEAVVEEARGQFKELREGVQAGDEMAREKLGVALQDARSELAAILTPAQREKLRGLMEQSSPPSPTTRPRMEPGMMDGDGAISRRERRRGAYEGRPATRPAAVAAPAALKPGARAPDFTLNRLGGQPIRLTSFEGRTLVLVFGSYSCPSFRQRAAGLEQLKKEFGQRAAFLVVYTKEAHPKGQWDVERNRDAGIEVESHKDVAAREGMAEKAKDALKLTIPIAVDGMDDAVADAYGLAPNGAVVIGRDLKIVASQQWFDPYTLRRHIEASSKPATRPAAAAASAD